MESHYPEQNEKLPSPWPVNSS